MVFTGRGRWDAWQQEWELLYPFTGNTSPTRTLLQNARRFVPVVGDALFNHRFGELENRALVDLFDLAAISPSEVRRVATRAAGGTLDLRGLTPCAQLAVFAELREMRAMTEEQLDDLMTAWLRRLGERRQCRRELSAASEDPTTWSYTGGQRFVIRLIAIRPSTPGLFPTVNNSGAAALGVNTNAVRISG